MFKVEYEVNLWQSFPLLCLYVNFPILHISREINVQVFAVSLPFPHFPYKKTEKDFLTRQAIGTDFLTPSNAGATFVQSTRTQIFFKRI